MSEIELRECPFCGGEAAHGKTRYSKPLDDITWAEDDAPITEAFFVNCTRCSASIRPFSGGQRTPDKAQAKWNTRPRDEALLEALEGCCVVIDLLKEHCQRIDSAQKSFHNCEEWHSEDAPEYKAHKEEQDRKFAEARKAAKELEEKVQAELQHIKRYMRDRGNVGHVAYNRISTALDALDFVDENEDDIARCECDQFYFIKDAIEDGDEVFCSAECCQSYLDQRAHERTLRGPQ